MPAPTRFAVWALAWMSLCLAAGCDRRHEAPPPPPPPVTKPSPHAPSAEAGREEFLVKLAALRHLVADQPRAADRGTYAAYLIQDDDDAGQLAAALSSASDGSGPPVVASLDSYRKKGRTIDAATGKPVKVFHVRLVRPPGEAPTAEVIASWRAGRLAGTSYRYRLRKEANAWVFSDRVDEGP
jgi:hypothetical protein